MPYITVAHENSQAIENYYEDIGQGTPVVLIHGWPLSGHSWEKQISALVEAGFRVITYDRRGFGQSGRPSGGYEYNALAADLNVLMTELNLSDAILVGFSMGTGEVARYLGHYGSERVSKAVFISSLPPFLLKSDDNPSGVEIGVIEGIKQEIRKDRLAFLTKFLEGFYNADKLLGSRVSDEVLLWSWDTASRASAVATHDCVDAWITDFREDIAKIKIPTLTIHGDQDRILPIDATGKLLHEMIDGSKYVVLKDGPHGVLWTHAEEVNQSLLDFVQEGAEKRRPRQKEKAASISLQ